MYQRVPWSIPVGDWAGQTVVLVCGGTSVETQDHELLHGHKVVLLNSSYERLDCYRKTKPPYIPHADALIFGDARWWSDHERELKRFTGEIVTTVCEVKLPERVRWCQKAGTLATEPTKLMMHWTSICPALNFIAHRIGAKTGGRIVLLGADGKFSPDGRTHHHTKHRWAHMKKAWDLHAQDLGSIVKPMKRLFGIEVINASPGSAYTMFPVMTLEEALKSN